MLCFNSNLLIEHDVLHDGSKLLADRPMKDEKLAQGLVIDDYFKGPVRVQFSWSHLL